MWQVPAWGPTVYLPPAWWLRLSCVTWEAEEVTGVAGNYNLVSDRAGIPTSFSPKPLLWRFEDSCAVLTVPAARAPALALRSIICPFLIGPLPKGSGGRTQFFDLLTYNVLPSSPPPPLHPWSWHDCTSETSNFPPCGSHFLPFRVWC